MTSSSRLDNQEDTRENVTSYPLGNVTSSGNETSSQDDEGIAQSANATTSGSQSNTVTSGNGSATKVEIQRYEIDANNGLHVIHPAAAMSQGMYILEIDYEILPDGKTIYSASFGEPGEEK